MESAGSGAGRLKPHEWTAKLLLMPPETRVGALSAECPPQWHDMIMKTVASITMRDPMVYVRRILKAPDRMARREILAHVPHEHRAGVEATVRGIFDRRRT